MIDIKPCPFCGRPHLREEYDEKYGVHYICCEKCSGRADIDDWNYRAPTASDDKLDRIRRILFEWLRDDSVDSSNVAMMDITTVLDDEVP